MEEDKEELKTITSLLEKELKLINKLKEFTLITFSITSIILSIISLSYIKELQAKNEVLDEKIEILNNQIEDWKNRKDYLLTRAEMIDDLFIFSNIDDIVEYSPRIWSEE